jgi:uncharacterized protein with HEPN domain
MSDDDRREWRFYVEDMTRFAEKVVAFSATLGRESFTRDTVHYDAILRNLELIGEAATHIPEPVRQAHPDIPWRMIIATRNRLIHAYLGLDDDTLWSIVSDDVPSLIPRLRLLLTSAT